MLAFFLVLDFKSDEHNNIIYYMNTSEIPGELSRVNISSQLKIACYFTRENNMLFSQVKRSPLLWLNNLLKGT